MGSNQEGDSLVMDMRMLGATGSAHWFAFQSQCITTIAEIATANRRVSGP